jgi:hypothetical protein
MSTELTQARLKELLHYDPVTGIFTWRVTVSSKAQAGNAVGRADILHGYVRRHVDKQRFSEHRLVWLYMTGSWPENQLDHINGDRTDNRWGNLREATDAQNRQNMAKRKGSSSNLLGVKWSKLRGKWMASITRDYVTKHLGYFADELDAHQAYIRAKASLHTFNPTPRSEHATC